MGSKLGLILLLKGRIEFSQAIYDSAKQIARSYRNYYLFKRYDHNYEVEPEHIKTSPKGKQYVLIDVNKRGSIDGKSFDPKTRETLDAEKMNKLDYLMEASFWEAFKLTKRDILVIILSLFAGMGLLQIIRIILSMYGYYVP